MGSYPRKIVGWKNYGAWQEELELLGHTISPGGVASLVHVTRQGVQRAIEEGRVRAVYFYESERAKGPHGIEVSTRDAIAWAINRGLTVHQVGIWWPLLPELWADVEESLKGS